MAVGYTRNSEDLPVWHVQLLVRVADIPNAGTSDSVQALLNSPLIEYSPSSNSTWTDYAPRFKDAFGPLILWQDDFARGSTFPYDLKSTSVEQLSDITMITLLKDGTDDLAIAELALKVNGVEVFRKYFGDTRASSSWQGYIAAPPTFSFVIPHDELVSRFESIVGDSLHGTGAHWQETLRPVSITKIPIKKTDKYEQLHINLELAAEKYDVE